MNLKTKLEDDLKQAMRDGDDLTKRTLRLCLSAIKLAEVEERDTLEEGTILSILQKQVKSRQETIDEAQGVGRIDLVQGAQAEIAIIKAYLPQPLTHEELMDLVKEAIAEVNASEPQDMGRVMKELMPRIQGRADGKAASAAVREQLDS
jgi:uncharacterized protein YqeY